MKRRRIKAADIPILIMFAFFIAGVIWNDIGLSYIGIAFGAGAFVELLLWRRSERRRPKLDTVIGEIPIITSSLIPRNKIFIMHPSQYEKLLKNPPDWRQVKYATTEETHES